MKILSYLFYPKLLIAALLIDLSGILSFISKYLFKDTTYLKFLIIAMILDLITGITKVWVNEGSHKLLTSKGLRGTVSKAIQYGSFLIITHILTHYEINNVASTDFLWLNKLAFEFLILIEIKSVYENIVRINPKLNFVDKAIEKITNLIKTKIKENADNTNSTSAT